MSQIDQIISDVTGIATEKTKEITLDVTANLVESTPADTGWARANWVPAIGAKSTPSSYSRKDVASQDADQQGRILNVASNYTLDKGIVYVSNNVKYIRKLNNGYSKQEPAGFVKRAVVKASTEDQIVRN